MSGGIPQPTRDDAWLVQWLKGVEARLAKLEGVPSTPGSIGWPWLRPAVIGGTPTDAALEGDGPYRVTEGLNVWDNSGKRIWVRDTSGAWYKTQSLTTP